MNLKKCFKSYIITIDTVIINTMVIEIILIISMIMKIQIMSICNNDINDYCNN